MATQATGSAPLPRTGGPGRLEGRRALVIGGSSGIGLASAAVLLADGAVVTLCGRDAGRLAAAADRLRESRPEAANAVAGFVCDGMSGSDVQAAVEAASGGSALDIAVGVPGGGGFCPVLGYEDAAFSAEVDANVRPAFLLIKYAGLAMLRAGGGSIVLVSSTASVLSSPFLSAYCAGKAACDQLVRVAADELGEHGVRVNAVRPGLTRTGSTDALMETEELVAAFLAEQPLSRVGEPGDIAHAIRFLAGPESAWITGQLLTADGGHTLRKFPRLESVARAVVGEARFDAILRGEAPDSASRAADPGDRS